MKKILFLLAAVSLTLTSCLKDDGDFKNYQPVFPGLNIYYFGDIQQRVATQPLDQVMRLAVLLSEAKVQGKTIAELPSLTVSYEENGKTKVTNVFGEFFNNKTTISEASGNYTLEMDPVTLGYYANKGTITVITNGKPLLEETDVNNKWTVIMPLDYKVYLAAEENSPSATRPEMLLEGAFEIYRDGAEYKLSISHMKAYMKSSESIASDWSGLFTLTPPEGGMSLAYSACRGKKFKFEGRAEGPTCATFNGTSGAAMSYSIEKGVYKNSLQCLDGTEKYELTGVYGDYDQSQYPDPEVTMIWKLSADEKNISQTVIYNGYTVAF